MLRNRLQTAFASGAICAALCSLTLSPAVRAEQAQPAALSEAADAVSADMAEGAANAPVTIIEYSSLSCPHCAHFHTEVLPELKAQYIDTGKVRYVAREFPLNELALAGAVAARCLDPSRFFAFTGLLFAKQAT